MDNKVKQFHALLNKALSEPTFVQAFTHTSRKGFDFSVAVNDRMELVGDKVIDVLLYDWLYKNTEYENGRMDEIRQKFHSDKFLSKTYDKFQLDKYVRKNPGRPLNETIKANIIESLFYAAYIKGGLELAQEF